MISLGILALFTVVGIDVSILGGIINIKLLKTKL